MFRDSDSEQERTAYPATNPWTAQFAAWAIDEGMADDITSPAKTASSQFNVGRCLLALKHFLGRYMRFIREETGNGLPVAEGISRADQVWGAFCT